MKYQPDIECRDWTGCLTFQWTISDFHLIIKTLNLQQNRETSNTTKSYWTRFSGKHQSKVVFYRNGLVVISKALSKQAIDLVLSDCILVPILSKLPDSNITVIKKLTITNCIANIKLDAKLNMKDLQVHLSQQFGIQMTTHYSVLPTQIHSVQGVSVILTSRQAKVIKAHLIKDIYLFAIYLNQILRPFRENPITSIDVQTKNKIRAEQNKIQGQMCKQQSEFMAVKQQ